MKAQLILVLFVFGMTQIKADEKNLANKNKDLLFDLLYMSELITESMGRNTSVSNRSDLISQIKQVNIDQISAFTDLASYEIFSSKVSQVIKQLHINKTNNQSSNKEIEFPQATPVPECVNVDPVDVEVALAGKLVAEEILAYAKWECEETVLGENSALACLAPEVAVQVIKAEFEFGEFCLGNRGEANIDVILETTRSVGEHLNEFIDETITSRSTQESVDSVQDSINTTNDSLEQFLPLLNTNLDTALNDLEAANGLLSNIQSQAESLLFRTQINQIEIENIEVITSDIQQRAEEIRDDTQSVIATNQAMRAQLIALHDQTQNQLTAAHNTQIEYMLTKNPDKAPISYKLPSNKEGQLEQVREVLTKKIQLVASLGAQVSEAQKLLTVGDGHYNKQQYQAAFTNYSNAYKQLLRVKF